MFALLCQFSVSLLCISLLCQFKYVCTSSQWLKFPVYVGVTGGFKHFETGSTQGPPIIAITGRTYHLLRDTEYMDHSIHWFLYDEHMQETKVQQFGAHAVIIQAINDNLKVINPYANHLRNFQLTSRQ
ncbi:hypothetical protein PAXRUDRAFT_26922 [Paxillus rubicundulus Ve08.2h10]|uniref:Uncharacterized protein n=1 Tax=Paxillus rubicundulus Ve08.2h10 TaxID=930991 RepID=A0A0D0E3T7_9AGAM|nr:hypothetical protein PAXRUDRAFT_26922 [Paxillus rubicundulus Ve08.2h10]